MWWISCELIVGTTQGCVFFFFSSRRRHTRLQGDWSSDVCSSDLCSTRCRPHARPNCWPSCRSTTEARAMPNPTIVKEALQQAQALGLARIDAQMLLLHVLGRQSGGRAWLLDRKSVV